MREPARSIIVTMIILLPVGSMGDSLLLSSIYIPLCLAVGVCSLVIHRHSFSTTIILPPLLLFCLYLLLQLVPLPPDLIGLLSPTTGNAYHETVWSIQNEKWMPLAVHGEATVRALLFVAAIGGLSLAVSKFFADQGCFSRVFQYMNFVVVIWSISTIVMTTLLLFPSNFIPRHETITSIRNQLNLWTIFLMPVLMAGYVIHKPMVTRLTFVEKFREFFQAPTEYPHICGCVAIALVVLSTLLSQNWQGATLLLFTLLVFKSLILPGGELDKALWKWTLRVAAVACLVGLYLLQGHIPWSLSYSSSGASPYVSSWFYTWFGCGLGGHAELFPTTGSLLCQIATATGVGGLLELWLGMGVFGVFLLVVILVTLLRYASKGKWGHTRGTTHKLISGGVTSLFVLFFSGLNTPYLIWEALFAACAIVLLLMLSPRLCQEAVSRAGKDNQCHRFISLSLSLLFAAVMMFSALFYVGIHSVAKIGKDVAIIHSGNLHPDQLTNLSKTINRTKKWFLPSQYSDLPLFQGYLGYYQMDEVQALASFERALVNRPLNPQIIVALAGTYDWLSKPARAEKLIGSLSFNNYRPGIFLERLLSRMFNDEISANGLMVVQKIFDLCPEYAVKCMNLLYVNGWNHNNIQDVLPAKTRVWFDFGNMLYAQGEVEKAEEAYLRAVAMNDPENRGEKASYNHVVEYFIATGQLVKALIVAEAGVENFPKSGHLRRVLADVHSRLGNENKARQGHHQAEMLDRGPRRETFN